jgi:hypothetical protein
MKHKSAGVLVNHNSLPRIALAAISILLVSVSVQNALASQASTQETFRGIVANANERNDTLTIQLPSWHHGRL